MSTLVFIHGPNGVGKSAVCRAVHQRLAHSAWLESEWCRMIRPFVWNEETISLTINNLSSMLRNYLTCPWIDHVLFSYGFHGPRQRIWEALRGGLEDISYRFIPITLACGEEEHIARMIRDGRDPARRQRAVAERYHYDGLSFPGIDTTHLTIDQVADRAIEIICMSA